MSGDGAKAGANAGAPSYAEREANIAALNGCAVPHAFVRVMDKSWPGEEPQRKALFRCVRCGGTVRGTAAHWYAQGMMHAEAAR